MYFSKIILNNKEKLLNAYFIHKLNVHTVTNITKKAHIMHKTKIQFIKTTFKF